MQSTDLFPGLPLCLRHLLSRFEPMCRRGHLLENMSFADVILGILEFLLELLEESELINGEWDRHCGDSKLNKSSGGFFGVSREVETLKHICVYHLSFGSTSAPE